MLKPGLIAGLGLLLMVFAAIFAQVARSDVHSSIFGFGILAFALVVVLDGVVAWALYLFFKPVDQRLSLITAGFRTVYAALFAASLSNLIGILNSLNNPNEITALMQAFDRGWDFALIFFGIHLGLLGYLTLKAKSIPKFLGVLLIIAGLGYLIDSLGKMLIADYTLTLSLFTFVGELFLMFWLLLKGARS